MIVATSIVRTIPNGSHKFLEVASGVWSYAESRAGSTPANDKAADQRFLPRSPLRQRILVSGVQDRSTQGVGDRPTGTDGCKRLVMHLEWDASATQSFGLEIWLRRVVISACGCAHGPRKSIMVT